MSSAPEWEISPTPTDLPELPEAEQMGNRSFRILDREWEEFMSIAGRHGRTASDVTRYLIQDFLAKQRR